MFVDMKMVPGKQFENFYWMEGPLEGDQGCRITVLHNGQTAQCSHCLRRDNSCPGAGVGKVCEKMGTPRGLIADYMAHLKIEHNYVSLKMKYRETEFPALNGHSHREDGFQHMVEEEADPENPPVADLIILKEKLSEVEKQLSESNAARQEMQISLPRISFEIKGLSYDGSRKLVPTQFSKTVPPEGAPKTGQPIQYTQ